MTLTSSVLGYFRLVLTFVTCFECYVSKFYVEQKNEHFSLLQSGIWWEAKYKIIHMKYIGRIVFFHVARRFDDCSEFFTFAKIASMKNWVWKKFEMKKNNQQQKKWKPTVD